MDRFHCVGKAVVGGVKLAVYLAKPLVTRKSLIYPGKYEFAPSRSLPMNCAVVCALTMAVTEDQDVSNVPLTNMRSVELALETAKCVQVFNGTVVDPVYCVPVNISGFSTPPEVRRPQAHGLKFAPLLASIKAA